MKSRLISLCKISREHLQYLVLGATSISLGVVLLRIIGSAYAGYHSTPGLELGTPNQAFYNAFLGAANSYFFAFTNHIMHQYAIAGLMPLVFYFSRFRFMVNNFPGRMASFFLLTTSLITLVHLVLFRNELGKGFWDNPLLDLTLIALSVPSLIYFSLLILAGLIHFAHNDISWEVVQENLRKNYAKYLVVFLLLLTALRAYNDAHLKLLAHWTSPLASFALTLPPFLFGLFIFLYFVRSLSGSKVPTKRAFGLFFIAVPLFFISSTLLFGLLYSILPQESPGLFLLVIQLMIYYFSISLFSLYALSITIKIAFQSEQDSIALTADGPSRARPNANSV